MLTVKQNIIDVTIHLQTICAQSQGMIAIHREAGNMLAVVTWQRIARNDYRTMWEYLQRCI